MGNVPPGTTPRPDLPPQSYRIEDIGKASVPQLTPDELHTVAAIARYTRDRHLRFAWLEYATTPRHFIVFDATDGPCEVWAGGYQVLNGACNEFYQPGENPYGTHAVPDCWGPPRPWMTPTPKQ